MTLKIILLFLFFCGPAFGYGNNLTLEIIAPKASGSGTPAISANHRCFRAYTGLQYTFRVQAIGGKYPYTFALSNQPSGMTISSNGTITWTSPASTASNIVVRVTDADGDYVDGTWTITVGTSGFYFVDDSAGSGGTGAIDSPFDSIDDILALEDEDGIVYLRAGNYTVSSYHAEYAGWPYGGSLAYNSSPHIFLAYPGETVNITDGFFECAEQTTPYYFDGINFSGQEEYAFVAGSNNDYFTVVNCTFSGLTTSRASNHNQGHFFTTETGTGYYLVWQGNTLHDYTGVAGIGSLYSQTKALLEGNTFYNQSSYGSNIEVALALKLEVDSSTVRSNNCQITAGDCLGASVNGMFNESDNNEVCFNLFESSGYQTARYNNDGNQGEMWSYRNTYAGPVAIQQLAAGSCEGPWHFENDIFQNAASGITSSYADCITTDTNNLKDTSGIVDSNGLLINRAYVGIYGWEIGVTTATVAGVTIPGGVTLH